MSPLEKETKLLISPADYQRLRSAGTILQCADQLNIYLHDPARVGERGETFRVRFETGKAPAATLKLPIGWKEGMRQMMEVERPLSEMGPDFHPRPRRWVRIEPPVPDELARYFQSMGVKRLRRLGWIRNRRCILDLGMEDTVEIDRYSLPGGQLLHEVEIENPADTVHEALVERIKALAPSAEITRMGKFSRFLASVGLGAEDGPLPG